MSSITSLDDPERHINVIIANTGACESVPIYFDSTLSDIKAYIQGDSSSFSSISSSSEKEDDILIFNEDGEVYKETIPNSNVNTVFAAIKTKNEELRPVPFSPIFPPSHEKYLTSQSRGDYHKILLALHSFVEAIQNNVGHNEEQFSKLVENHCRILNALKATLTHLSDPLYTKIRDLLADINVKHSKVYNTNLDDQALKDTPLPPQLAKKYPPVSAKRQYSCLIDVVAVNGESPTKIRTRLLDHLNHREQQVGDLKQRFKQYKQNDLEQVFSDLDSKYVPNDFINRLETAKKEAKGLNERAETIKKEIDGYLSSLSLINSLSDSEKANFWSNLTQFLKNIHKNCIRPLEKSAAEVHQGLAATNSLRMSIQSIISNSIISFLNACESISKEENKFLFNQHHSETEFQNKYPRIQAASVLLTAFNKLIQEAKRRYNWHKEITVKKEKCNEEFQRECTQERNERKQKIEELELLKYQETLEQFPALAQFFAKALYAGNPTPPDSISFKDILSIKLPEIEQNLSIKDSTQSTEYQDANEMAEDAEWDMFNSSMLEEESFHYQPPNLQQQQESNLTESQLKAKDSTKITTISSGSSISDWTAEDEVHPFSSSENVKNLEKELEEKDAKITMLENELESLKQVHQEELSEETNQYKRIIQEKETKSENQIQVLEQQIKELHNDLEQKVETISSLRDSINNMEKQHEEELTQSELRYKTCVVEKAQELSSINKKLKEQEKEFNQTIEHKNAHISSLENTLEENAKQMEQIQSTLQERERELKERSETNEKLSEQIQTNLNEQFEKSQEAEQFKAEIETLNKQLNEYKTEIEYLQNDIKSYEQKIDNYEMKVSELEKQKEEQETNHQQILAKSRQEKEDLETEINHNKQLIEEKENKIKQYKEQIDTYETELSDVKSEKSKLTCQVEQLSNTTQQFSTEIKELRQELSRSQYDSQMNCDKLNDEKQALQSKVNTLENEVQQFQTQTLQLEEQVESLNRQLHDSQVNQNELEHYKSQCSELNSQIASLTDDLSRKKALVADLEENLSETRSDVRRLSRCAKEAENVDPLRRMVQDKCEQIVNLQQRLEDLESVTDQENLCSELASIFNISSHSPDDITAHVVCLNNSSVKILSDKPQPSERLLFMRKGISFIAFHKRDGPLAVLDTAALDANLEGVNYVVGSVVYVEDKRTASGSDETGLEAGVEYFPVFAQLQDQDLDI